MNWTPLQIAAQKNFKELGEFFIEKGANIYAKNIIYQIIILSFLINLI